MSDKDADAGPLPALFATIHFRSDERPNGYTDEQIAELSRLANSGKAGDEPVGDDSA